MITFSVCAQSDGKAILNALREQDLLAINAAIDFAQEQGWPQEQVSSLFRSLTGERRERLSPDVLAVLFEVLLAGHR
jgi:hypothetical protein